MQLDQVNGGVAVEAGGVELDSADHIRAGGVQAIAAAELLAGRDEYARRYLAHYRRGRSP